MGVTQDLSEFSSGLTIDLIPAEVVSRARLLILDLVGNIVRGHETESTPAMLSTIGAFGLAQGTSRVFGDSRTFAPVGAALFQSMLAHSLDFDDTHAAGTLHPGAPVIPAALAAAEMANVSGATTVAAIVAGYEVICRVALALPAGAHYQRGFHPTATCGAFGAAAAAARVFGPDAAGVASALGIALSKIRCEYDPEIEAEFPINMSGKLSVHARGQVFVKKVVVPKGEPSNFLSGDELSAKFVDLAQPGLGEVQTAKLAAAILDIDRLHYVSKLFDLGSAST